MASREVPEWPSSNPMGHPAYRPDQRGATFRPGEGIPTRKEAEDERRERLDDPNRQTTVK